MKRLPSREPTVEGYALPRLAPPPSSILFDERTLEDSAPPTGSTPFGPATSEVDLAGFLDRGFIGRAGGLLWQAQRALERRNLPVSAPVVLAAGLAAVVGFFFVATFGVVHASDEATVATPRAAAALSAAPAALAASERTRPAEPTPAPLVYAAPSLAASPDADSADMTFEAPVADEVAPEAAPPTPHARRGARRARAQARLRQRRARARARRRARGSW